MKVTLRTFLDIVGNDLFDASLCKVQLEQPDEYGDPEFQEVSFPKKNGYGNNVICSMENLVPFFEHEIVKFKQERHWGEVTEQVLMLREIEKEKDVSLEERLSDAVDRSSGIKDNNREQDLKLI